MKPATSWRPRFYTTATLTNPTNTGLLEASADGGRYRAVIPGEYTDSAYPLLYYFQLRDLKGAAWLYPGLNADLANQPYFVVRHV